MRVARKVLPILMSVVLVVGLCPGLGFVARSAVPDTAYADDATQVMHRLYNPNSGEHFYTASEVERDAVAGAGWDYEGEGWTAPVTSSTPVYRLYSGTDHHYTTSAVERDHLVSVGWSDEGVGWYSDDAKGVPLYRQFNPNVDPSAPTNNSGSHNYTTSLDEHNMLVSIGWNDEGIGWYGVADNGILDDTNNAEEKIGVSSISAFIHEDMLVEDEETYIDVEFSPSYATNRTLEYTSSNASIADVDSNGIVYAKHPGTANITITSVDNPEAKTMVTVTVVESEYDVHEEDDPDVIDVADIDPNHENVIKYSDKTNVLQGADYKINVDGSVDVQANTLPNNLKPNDIVIFEPTDENPYGAAVIVDAGGAYDGKLSGGIPELQDVCDEIDVESYAGISEGAFIPDEDIELLDTEKVEIEEDGPTDTTIIYPEKTFQANSDAQLKACSSPDKTRSVSDKGKSTSKFTFKYKGISFSVSLTGKVKYDYDLWGVNELYVGVVAKNEFGFKGKLSNIFGTDDVNKKLGEVIFATPVPGLSLKGSVWFHLGADGEVSVTLEASCEAGVQYTKTNGVKVPIKHQSSPTLKTSAELNTGFDFVGTLQLFAIDVADPSINIRFKLGLDSADAKVRSNGLRCNDIKLKFAPSISIGTHQGLCKKLGISYSKKIAEKTIKKWHLENGNIINECTWKGNNKQYERVSDLLPTDSGMGSWGSSDALRITLTWGANPRDLDSHLLGSLSSGDEFHIYYGDDECRENGIIKAFLDVDDTEGYGYETSTIYSPGDKPYHFYVHLFAGSGSIATSGAQVNIYKGNRLLKTYDAPSNLEGDYWYVFTYDAKTETFYPYSDEYVE